MRNVFLLGGHGDIGTAIGQKFTDAGDVVFRPTRQELDLEKIEQIDAFMSGLRNPIDVLINCAGWNNPKPGDLVSIEEIQRGMQINICGFHRIAQIVAETMKEKREGHILALSSLYGFISRKNRLPYVMAKHALNGWVKTMAIEWGEYNIKVNALSPGYVDTQMTRKNNDESTIKAFAERIPLRRLANPKDIAEVAYFLCSPNNQYINGHDLVVDGGYSIGGFQS